MILYKKYCFVFTLFLCISTTISASTVTDFFKTLTSTHQCLEDIRTQLLSEEINTEALQRSLQYLGFLTHCGIIQWKKLDTEEKNSISEPFILVSKLFITTLRSTSFEEGSELEIERKKLLAHAEEFLPEAAHRVFVETDELLSYREPSDCVDYLRSSLAEVTRSPSWSCTEQKLIEEYAEILATSITQLQRTATAIWMDKIV